MLKWQIGSVQITQIVELTTASLGPYLLPQATPEVLRREEWLRPFCDPEGKLVLSVHTLVVESQGECLLVDEVLFYQACDEPYHGPVPKGESAVATAVYKLGPSPPFLQHEACRGELHFDAMSDLACSKCGRLARDGAKLYVRGDFAICRSCALRGAGVLVDPGAKRIWFSRMIQFVGSRAVPLPASQPILAQLLRTLKSHPGVVVRFEGHVNATCGLECRGATGKPCNCLLYTSPSPRDGLLSRMPSSA